MANGNDTGNWARWIIGILVTTGLTGTAALTKATWTNSEEIAAIRERDKYVIDEMRAMRIELGQVRSDMNTLLSRKP